MNKVVIGIGAALILAATIQSCSQSEAITETDTSALIGNPFEGFGPETTEFSFSNANDWQRHLPSGTNILIPKEIFQNKNGEPVTDVVLKYAEFHDAADIMLSGITMKYDSAGESHDFKSAGMFDIRVYDKSGEELRLREGKAVEVQMASFKEGNEYSFYQIDDATGKWNYEGIAAPLENTQKLAALADLEVPPTAPLPPKKPSGNQLLDLDVDYSQHPELKIFDRVLWEYAGGKRLPDSTAKKLATGSWNNAEVVKTESGVYKIRFEKGVNTIEVEVVPVLTGKEYETASNDYSSGFARFQAQMASYTEELEQVNAEAGLLRSFSVTNLGACNWDTFMKWVARGTRRQLAADFKFGKDVDPTTVELMHITNGGTSVVRYNAASWRNFIFNPEIDNKIIAILPNDEVAVCKDKDFLKKEHGQEHTFRMTSVGKVKDREELKGIIRSL